ncbi:hypothetical protein [Kaarinaea lacus]
MKVAFIVPKDDSSHSPLHQLAQCRIFPPVGLARMAGLVGKNASVNLVDERIGSAIHEQRVNVAIIFINSYNRQRAYDLADQYHDYGSYVVFTGPLLAQAANEASCYADSLFIGTGEDCMAEFVTEYRNGNPKPIYNAMVGTTPTISAPSPRKTATFGNTALSLM